MTKQLVLGDVEEFPNNELDCFKKLIEINVYLTQGAGKFMVQTTNEDRPKFYNTIKYYF